MTSRILVIEDNADLAFGLRNNFEIEGYEVDVAGDGLVGLARAREWTPDLVVLDLMLPGMDGYRVLRTLRAEGFDAPVLILTARGEEADKVTGFRHGADDYVTKPFGVLELLARVEALLRRTSRGKPLDVHDAARFGAITMRARVAACSSRWGIGEPRPARVRSAPRPVRPARGRRVTSRAAA
jgi:DNA-binding response OmpR family regulator